MACSHVRTLESHRDVPGFLVGPTFGQADRRVRVDYTFF